jgi:hypothetical protein
LAIFFEDLRAVCHVEWRSLEGERQENSVIFSFSTFDKFVIIQNHFGVESAPSAVSKSVSESNMMCKKAPTTASVASWAKEECFDDLGLCRNSDESAPSAVNKSVSETNMMCKKAPNTASAALLAEERFDNLGVSGNNGESASMMREKAPNMASVASLTDECLDDLGDSVTRGAIHQLLSIILKLRILVLLPVSTMPYVNG